MLGLLRHLPEPPQDFRKLCRDAQDVDALHRLARFQLEGTQLEQLDRARRRIVAEPPKDSFRLGLLCNATTDFLPPAISASALRHGLNVDVVLGDYGQTIQDAMSPASAVNQARCDAVLLALDVRGLQLVPAPGAPQGDPVGDAISLLTQTRDALKAAHKTVVIFQTVAPPLMPVFGNMDSVIGRNARAIAQEFNLALRQLIAGSKGDLLLDVEALANGVGLQQWHSPAQWNHAKLQFSQAALPVYAENVARLIGALRGKSRKCLVLDLDNTIWGGAVGDLGVEGIELGEGSALGEAFLEVQRTVLRLRERGVILAVCSKNDHDAAMEPFRRHPEMLLKEEHISVFQANWIDKATNLEEIAKLLNIGVDSLVMLDDNPAERIHIRESLPAIAVPELPDDPSLYPSILLNAGYFETVSFTVEDAQRADQYSANAKRSALETSSRDPHAFLSALEMKISFAPFDRMNRSRIAQLINKTNQFNLTTRRYTEAEVESIERDPSYWTMQVRLVDRFGDNGMISCVICKEAAGGVWEIDTWLMSCRVLARRVEECSMAIVVEHAKARGVHTLIGRYRPTAKNAMVKDFFPKLGFELVEQTSEETSWRLDVARFSVADLPMVIEDTLAKPFGLAGDTDQTMQAAG
jgi:FkbH-like protein